MEKFIIRRELLNYIKRGEEVGYFGHSRMLFPQMIDISCRVIDLETVAHLKKMFTQYNLPPPHFYFTTGKSTNHRVSNQATVIYLVIEGKRSAIPLGVKPV